MNYQSQTAGVNHSINHFRSNSTIEEAKTTVVSIKDQKENAVPKTFATQQ